MPEHNMNEYYRARAPEYEQIYYRDNPERRGELAAEAISLQRLVAGKTVLEFVCGTGYWTRVMSQRAQQITAVDLAPEMIAEAKEKSYGCPVTFDQADMFEFSVEADSFDIVALGFWLSHQPKQEFGRLFETLCAPLKKSGLIWMIDNNPPAESDGNDSPQVDRFGNNYKKRYLSSGKEFLIIKNYFNPADLKACLDPGFEIKSLKHNKYYWSVQLAPIRV